MADSRDRYKQNVKGKFYVDTQCIDCDLCRQIAPDTFSRHEDGGHSFVYKQPISQEDKEKAEEALEHCPVDAIGNDG